VLNQLEHIGIDISREIRRTIERDGQVRIPWGPYKVDLFFSTIALHDAMAGRLRRVPFADRTIPILAPEHLIVCKAIFNRAKDWVDIESMVGDNPDLDVEEARRWVAAIAGDDTERRLDILFTTRSGG